MRIVHAADIHLDSPLLGLARLEDDDVARVLRQASRRALENLVQLVVDESAVALVLAGDIYDGDWPDYATGRFFAQQMGRLNDHGIPVFMAAGNHDAESQISRALRMPPNVTVLSTDSPQTVEMPDLGLAIHGQGFATRAVKANLALAYPTRMHGIVNVGILHTSVTGAEGHEPYAPCSPEDLARTEYDYFALGHVHARYVVNAGHRVAAFSGNLQGRKPSESGPKGALVVDVEADQQAVLRHVPLDVARWARVMVDATAATDFDDVLNRVEEELRNAKSEADGRLLIARVEIAGTTPAAATLADSERLQEEVGLIGDRHGITLERTRSRALAPTEWQSLEPELLEAIRCAAEALVTDPVQLRELARALDREVGRELRDQGLVDLKDDDALVSLATDASIALLARLNGEGD
ncbi:MAG TPA: DNA repair exonuclease [Chloroflexi bacterium]|nr:DNA repair exonuclease [Chloroflexota bacterium]